MLNKSQDLYALKRVGYQLKSINYEVNPDDGTCMICYCDFEVLHICNLTTNTTLDICTICLEKMHKLAQDGRGS